MDTLLRSTSVPSFLLLLILIFAASAHARLAEVVQGKNSEFGYFVLSLQWPGTICQSTRHCCPSNGCCKSSVSLTEFTIHGLWPNYNDGTWPACCSGSDFDVKKITPLIGKLTKYWPTLSCSSSSTCHGGKGLFWAHEWEKHGTCSYPVVRDEYSYFSTALDLYFEYNVTKILAGAGYVPTENGDKYLLSDIVATIKKAVGSSPLLVCKKGAIEELRLCFYKDLKPRDCVIESSIHDERLEWRSSCPRYITLPDYNPHYLLQRGGDTSIEWLYA